MLKAIARRTARGMAGALPGGVRFARRLRRRSVVIVMYHGVTERHLPVFNWCQLHHEDFEKQIAFLSDQYRICPLHEIIENLNRGSSLPDRAVCVTFDDGFRSVLRTAYPILSEYQTPATVFLVTSLIGTPQPPWPERLYARLASTKLDSIQFEGISFPLKTVQDKASVFARIGSRLISLPVERKDVVLAELLDALGQTSVQDCDALSMLTWEDVEKLGATGLVSFGSHTHTHQILSRCSPERQLCELRTSRNLLLEHVGSAGLFAYPNGTPADYTTETKRLLSELGYSCALTTIRGVNTCRTDVYELRRVGIGADISFSEFQLGMLGW